MTNKYFNNDTNYALPRSPIESQDLFDILNRIARGFDLLPDTAGGGTKGFLGGTFNQPSIFSPTLTGGTVGSDSLPSQVVSSQLKIPSRDGAPVGFSSFGDQPLHMIYERATNKLWIYNGAWRSITFS